MDEPIVATGNFQITLTLTDKRQLTMSGYIYNKDDTHEINKRIDLYMDVLDRQAVRTDIMFTKVAQLAAEEVELGQLAARYEAFKNLKNSGVKLNIPQQNELKEYDAKVQFRKRNMDSIRAAIAEGKKRLNGAAAA